MSCVRTCTSIPHTHTPVDDPLLWLPLLYQMRENVLLLLFAWLCRDSHFVCVCVCGVVDTHGLINGLVDSDNRNVMSLWQSFVDHIICT